MRGRAAATLAAALTAVLLAASPPVAAAVAATSPPWDEPERALADAARLQLEALDARGLEEAVRRVNDAAGPYLPALEVPRQPDAPLAFWRQPGEVATGLGRYFAGQFREQLSFLAGILALAVLAAMLAGTGGIMSDAAVARTAHGVLLLALFGLAMAGFQQAVSTAQGAVQAMVSLLLATLPLLLGLAAAGGAAGAAGLLHPFVVGAVNLGGMAVERGVLPLLLVAAVVELVARFAGGVRLDGLARFLRQLALVGLGVVLSAFLGVCTVLGVAASLADGVGLRTARFLAKNLIPVVGGMFADAAELVATSSLLLRQSLGLVGLTAVFILAALPILKILALALAYRLGAVAVQPLGGGEVAACLEGLAGTLTLIAVAVGAVAVLFFLGLGSLLTAGGLVRG